MGKVLDYQCPSCNAPLHYNAKGKNWICDYCDSVFTIDDLKEKKGETKFDDEGSLSVEYNTYNCPDCGASVVCDSTTSATFCIYCGNTSILKNRLSGEFKPSKIIPFENTKEDAVEAFLKLKKGRMFMPKLFNDAKNVEKIRGVYIPFWLYDIDVNGDYNCDGKRISSWTSGEYHYTKTDIYKFYRTVSMKFHKIPVDGANKFDNDMMNSIEPFDFSKLVDFDPAYLLGFLAEMYDVNSDEALKDARDRSRNSAKSEVLSSMSGSSIFPFEDTLTPTVSNLEYVLLPVWMVNIKYKDKMHLFAMNGESGEIVGNIPLDKTKVFIVTIIAFVIFFIIGIAVCMFINKMGGI